jgi:hypothetical protein
MEIKFHYRIHKSLPGLSWAKSIQSTSQMLFFEDAF